jgi:hypothetical protein
MRYVGLLMGGLGSIHTDACLDEECVIYVHNTGKLDTIPAK